MIPTSKEHLDIEERKLKIGEYLEIDVIEATGLDTSKLLSAGMHLYK